jgi:hypothetical protein
MISRTFSGVVFISGLLLVHYLWVDFLYWCAFSINCCLHARMSEVEGFGVGYAAFGMNARGICGQKSAYYGRGVGSKSG